MWQTRSRIKREDERRRRTVEGAETVPRPRRNAYEDLKRTPNWKRAKVTPRNERSADGCVVRSSRRS